MRSITKEILFFAELKISSQINKPETFVHNVRKRQHKCVHCSMFDLQSIKCLSIRLCDAYSL